MKWIIILIIGLSLIGFNYAGAGDLIVDGKVGIGTTIPDAKEEIAIGTATEKGLIIKGATSQSANLLELQDNAGIARDYFSPYGLLYQNVTQPSFVSGVVGWYGYYGRGERSGSVSNQIARLMEAGFTEKISGGTNQRGAGVFTATLNYDSTANASGDLYSLASAGFNTAIYGGTASQIDSVSGLGSTIFVKPAAGKTFNTSNTSVGRFNFNLLIAEGTYISTNISGLTTNLTLARGNFTGSVQATDVAGFIIEGRVDNGGTGGTFSATNLFGAIVRDYGAYGSQGATITSVGGLKIDKQTVGTNRMGIWLNGDGEGADIVFGPNKNTSIYSNNGELFAKDGLGNVTQISPHDPETGEWIFYSRNVKTGKVMRVDMERLVKAVEKLTGERFMVEVYEDK